jgi:hypothetical protein
MQSEHPKIIYLLTKMLNLKGTFVSCLTSELLVSLFFSNITNIHSLDFCAVGFLLS